MAVLRRFIFLNEKAWGLKWKSENNAILVCTPQKITDRLLFRRPSLPLGRRE